MKIKKLEDLELESVSHNIEIKKKVLIRLGEIPKLTQLAKIYFSPGQVADAHRHSDMFEIFYVVKGSGEFKVDGRVVKADEGTCVVVEPGESHEVSNKTSEDLVISVMGIEQ